MQKSPTFECPAGRFLGWRDHDVVRATGIRYARAARFQPPTPEPEHQPVAASEGQLAAAAQSQQALIDATEWSPACPQPVDETGASLLPYFVGEMAYSEDCLRLSIAAPEDLTPEELGTVPVMVWIYGGGYLSGAGDSRAYDPALLVQEQRVVVVNVTFRVGLLGFLGGDSHRPANLGLLDLIAALQWVQRNIAGFGGDPDQVTLFGESAGADAIAHLMATREARGLFRRAICQSPPLGAAARRGRMTQAMAKRTQHLSPETPVAQLVETHVDAIRGVQRHGLPAVMPFGTQYGHPPLPTERAIEDAWRANASGVDLLIGTNSDELAFFAQGRGDVRAIARVPVLGKLLVGAVTGSLNAFVFDRPVDRFARRHARAGGRAYRYRLDWGAPGSEFYGAHTLDLALVFGNQSAWRDSPLLAGFAWDHVHQVGLQIREVWGHFARTGQAPTGTTAGALEIQPV